MTCQVRPEPECLSLLFLLSDDNLGNVLCLREQCFNLSAAFSMVSKNPNMCVSHIPFSSYFPAFAPVAYIHAPSEWHGHASVLFCTHLSSRPCPCHPFSITSYLSSQGWTFYSCAISSDFADFSLLLFFVRLFLVFYFVLFCFVWFDRQRRHALSWRGGSN